MHIGGRSNNNSNRGGSRFSNNGGSYNNRGRSNYGENNNMRGSGGYRNSNYNNFTGNGYRTNGFSSGGFRSAQGDGSKNDWYSTTKVQKVDFAKANLVPLQKNFYKLHAAVQQRGQAEVDQWLAEKNVTLDGEDIPRPVVEFSEGGFPDEIQSLFNAHFTKPTVIQSIAWPVALSGRDLIAIAQTGSGKTLGFTIPAIIHTLNQPPRSAVDGPIVVILLPTRELAQQVEVGAKDYCQALGLSLVCIYGGASKGPQARALERGVDIVVATPGRLNDFLENGTTNMTRCSYLVLDEADRMLDMGFEPQIRQIVGQTRPDRQTLMFSATWPQEVRALASAFQKDPVFLNVGSMDLSANHNIEQNVEVIEEAQKPTRLFQLLEEIMQQKECKTIIFTETKRRADDLTRGMRKDGYQALCIHGDKQQSERDWTLSQFRNGKIPILLATDVAARGLDVKDIRFVINYDYPNNSEDYVHRIGRTGRVNSSGTAYTFFTRKNAPKARDLVKVMEEANQEIPKELQNMINGRSLPMSFGAARKRNYADSARGRDVGGKRGRFEGNFRGRGGRGSYWNNPEDSSGKNNGNGLPSSFGATSKAARW